MATITIEQSSSRPAIEVTMVPVDAIRPHPGNPRLFATNDADDPSLVELAESIRAVGLLQPVLVRPHPEGPGVGIHDMQLVAGERRWRACRLAGVEEIPAFVRDLSTAEALEVLVTENLQREDLKPLEEARGVRALVEARGWSMQDVADHLGRSASWVVQRSRLAELSPTWMKAATNPASPVSGWPVGTLVAIARLAPEAQEQLAVHDAWMMKKEHPSRGHLERVVAELLRELCRAPWKLEDGALHPDAGPCVSCRKRSCCHPGLFDGFDDGEETPAEPSDRCLDSTCWDEKVRRFVAAREAELRATRSDLVLVNGNGFQEFTPGYRRDAKAGWDVGQAKKSTPGAVMALVVTGPDAGTTRWVTVYRQSTGRTDKPVGPDGSTLPTPLAERRAALTIRRVVKAVGLLEEVLVASEPPMLSTLVALAAVFGTDRRENSRSGTYFEPGEKASLTPERTPWGAFDALEKVTNEALSTTAASTKLWAQVVEVLRKRLMYWSGCSMSELWGEAERIAGVIGANLEVYREQATAAIPEPKSWAGLNEDGTPKSAVTRTAVPAPEPPPAAEPAKKPRAPRKAKPKAPPAGVCRVCGCTEDNACETAHGIPCHWLEPNLCSACSEEGNASPDPDEVLADDDEAAQAANGAS